MSLMPLIHGKYLNYRQFFEALTVFQHLWQHHLHLMDKTAELYIQRCQQLLNQELENDWQGVAVMENK